MGTLSTQIVLAIALICAGCTLTPPEGRDISDQPPPRDLPLLEGSPADVFVPIEPYPFDEFWGEEMEYWDLNEDGIIDREEELFSFPNEAVQVRVLQFNAAGNVSAPIVGLSAAGGTYQVIVDYAKYRTDRDSESYIYQSGIGIRIRANIVTFEANLDVSSLFGIAFHAESNRLSGTLRFETIGISGRHTTAMIPLPSEISITSVQNAMQAASVIKASLYDPAETQIYPQVFAYRYAPEDRRANESVDECESIDESESIDENN